MGWLDTFKSKNPKVKCFICNKNVREDKTSLVKYRYGADSGAIGSVNICEKCAEDLAPKKDEEYGESI